MISFIPKLLYLATFKKVVRVEFDKTSALEPFSGSAGPNSDLSYPATSPRGLYISKDLSLSEMDFDTEIASMRAKVDAAENAKVGTPFLGSN